MRYIIHTLLIDLIYEKPTAGYNAYLIAYYKKTWEERAESNCKDAPRLQIFTSYTDEDK